MSSDEEEYNNESDSNKEDDEIDTDSVLIDNIDIVKKIIEYFSEATINMIISGLKKLGKEDHEIISITNKDISLVRYLRSNEYHTKVTDTIKRINDANNDDEVENITADFVSMIEKKCAQSVSCDFSVGIIEKGLMEFYRLYHIRRMNISLSVPKSDAVINSLVTIPIVYYIYYNRKPHLLIHRKLKKIMLIANISTYFINAMILNVIEKNTSIDDAELNPEIRYKIEKYVCETIGFYAVEYMKSGISNDDIMNIFVSVDDILGEYIDMDEIINYMSNSISSRPFDISYYDYTGFSNALIENDFIYQKQQDLLKNNVYKKAVASRTIRYNQMISRKENITNAFDTIVHILTHYNIIRDITNENIDFILGDILTEFTPVDRQKIYDRILNSKDIKMFPYEQDEKNNFQMAELAEVMSIVDMEGIGIENIYTGVSLKIYIMKLISNFSEAVIKMLISGMHKSGFTYDEILDIIETESSVISHLRSYYYKSDIQNVINMIQNFKITKGKHVLEIITKVQRFMNHHISYISNSFGLNIEYIEKGVLEYYTHLYQKGITTNVDNVTLNFFAEYPLSSIINRSTEPFSILSKNLRKIYIMTYIRPHNIITYSIRRLRSIFTEPDVSQDILIEASANFVVSYIQSHIYEEDATDIVYYILDFVNDLGMSIPDTINSIAKQLKPMYPIIRGKYHTIFTEAANDLETDNIISQEDMIYISEINNILCKTIIDDAVIFTSNNNSIDDISNYIFQYFDYYSVLIFINRENISNIVTLNTISKMEPSVEWKDSDIKEIHNSILELKSYRIFQ